jgi:hypothetical protein
MNTVNLIVKGHLIQDLRGILKCISMLLILNLILLSHISAQIKADTKKKEIDELRLKLNEDGSHYVKFNILG